jgi:two-component system chemotaxis response regulator CheB
MARRNVTRPMGSGRIVVIGASSGGVKALQKLAAGLAPGFPAPVLVVQHIGSYPSILPSLLMRNTGASASHAVDGEALRDGHIHVAPPDLHMLVEDGRIRLTHGPKENHARPAIDPLFRSAAVARGPDVIGVVLTGFLDDGTAGLQAIKRCGGTTVVQDPQDAQAPEMPRSALRYVEVDHVAPLGSMGDLLLSLAQRPSRATAAVPPELEHESDIALGKGNYMEHLEAIGNPSTFVCPDCNGALWEVRDAQPRRFRCHTGHGYTLKALQHTQSDVTDEALWNGYRALQERELLLAALADAAEAGEKGRLRAQAKIAGQHANELRALIERVPPPPVTGTEGR